MGVEFIGPEGLIVQQECRRCGDCCRKGSPTMHTVDADLIRNGVFSYGDVYTIRKDELVYNNIDDEFFNIDYELIKMREKPGSRQCKFFADKTEGDDSTALCTVYENRPAQCQNFECWNHDKLMATFAEEKLTRHHLLEGNDALLNLVEQHQEKCSYQMIGEAFQATRKGQDKVGVILDALQYDTFLRSFVTEKMGVPEQYRDLLLGRPLIETIIMFGYKVEKDAEGNYCLAYM
jgi:Fe-S-cluster containining protein